MPGLIIIRPKQFCDSRGMFKETFKNSDFKLAGLPTVFLQENFSLSHKAVLRGMHFQYSPRSQGKLVHVVVGKVWDVAVDIRPDSQTFGKWFGVELSAAEGTMLWIPSGFAHGFQALDDGTIFSYKCTNEYDNSLEGGIRWNDPNLDIQWPMQPSDISERDKGWPLFVDLHLRD